VTVPTPARDCQWIARPFQQLAPLAGKTRSAWNGILDDAGLGEDVVRRSLRHTAATWLMQRGPIDGKGAGWLGMTLEQLENGYGHHHPDFQEEAASAFGQRQV
jgi:integrase